MINTVYWFFCNLALLTKNHFIMKNKILFVISLLFGLMFINAGLNKIFNYLPMPPDLPEKMVQLMKAFTEVGWLMPLVAVVEIIGGLLVIIPKTRAFGAIVLFPIMIGIVLINTIQDTSGLPIAGVFSVVLAWIIWENKGKYAQLF